ncbi:MAG: hypothetical protein JO040_03405 [Gemmatimonadetes bacterium]|nr:hypothetical protein [Gemmatimonadota bacterium]
MPEPFTIDRDYVAATDWQTLKRELFNRTGDEHEASSILRGIERLGSDPSIHHYEVVPHPNERVYTGAPTTVWTVTAVPA